MTIHLHKASPISAADTHDGLTGYLRQAADLSRITDPRLQRALSWWQGLVEAAGAPIPDRIQLDPCAIRDLLPYGMLWDVVHGPGGSLKYRCRLSGTMLDEIRGTQCIGQWLDEKFGDFAPQMQLEYDTGVRHARPLHTRHSMTWVNKPYYKYNRLLLPFTHHAGAARSGDPHADPDRVALLFNVISFIGD
jgi:hypothetical protein